MRPRVYAFGLRGLEVEGGIETHARELYGRLAALGYDITVLERCGHRAAPGGPRTKRIWSPRGVPLETLWHSLLCTLYCIARRPSLVHVHGIGPAFFALLLRIGGLRVVVTHHGHDYLAAKWGFIARTLLRTGERVGVRAAHAVICVSDTIRRNVAAEIRGRCDSIYNGIAPPPAQTLPMIGPLASLPSGSYVLMVGRLTQHKRIDDVVEAMQTATLRHLRLVVCGSAAGHDPYARTLRANVVTHGNVLLAGHVQPRFLAELYARSACTVMASTYEGMPLAVLEALACGATVLLSDIEAHVELELPSDQYFRAMNVADLAARLEALVASPRPCASRFLADRRFDWMHIATQTAAVFDAVLAPPVATGLRRRRADITLGQ